VVKSEAPATEKAARTRIEPGSSALYHFGNHNVESALGHHPGYVLMPEGSYVHPLLAADDPPVRRNSYLYYQLAVTPYAPSERYAGGRFAMMSDGSDTLGAWTARDRPIANRDIAAWYAISFHHITRMEDWPVMPTHWFGFTLMPHNFLATNPAMLGGGMACEPCERKCRAHHRIRRAGACRLCADLQRLRRRRALAQGRSQRPGQAGRTAWQYWNRSDLPPDKPSVKGLGRTLEAIIERVAESDDTMLVFALNRKPHRIAMKRSGNRYVGRLPEEMSLGAETVFATVEIPSGATVITAQPRWIDNERAIESAASGRHADPNHGVFSRRGFAGANEQRIIEAIHAISTNLFNFATPELADLASKRKGSNKQDDGADNESGPAGSVDPSKLTLRLTDQTAKNGGRFRTACMASRCEAL
jgi:hypothetical protein